jgi:hypothetical protein
MRGSLPPQPTSDVPLLVLYILTYPLSCYLGKAARNISDWLTTITCSILVSNTNIFSEILLIYLLIGLACAVESILEFAVAHGAASHGSGLPSEPPYAWCTRAAGSFRRCTGHRAALIGLGSCRTTTAIYWLKKAHLVDPSHVALNYLHLITLKTLLKPLPSLRLS